MTKDHRFLLVARHAHRDTSDRSLDNGLDDKGKKQAEKLKEFLLEQKWKVDEILSSPKLRCIQTVEPYSESIKIKVSIEKLLDEEGNESSKNFKERIQNFAKSWASLKKESSLICSHGDWIPDFFQSILQMNVDLNKGGLAIVQFSPEKEKWKLLEVYQKF